jgi:hypothetical protein
VLRNARDSRLDKPILVHVVTKKGKGYPPAEASADKYHGVVKFDVVTGKQSKPVANAPAYQAVFAKALIAEAEADRKIVAITAAMPSGTSLDKFAERFPSARFDVGIAEQHGVTFAAGLACEGFKPFAAIYSTFLQRAYDQCVHDVAIQKLPVRFAIDRAGLVGADGATHAGLVRRRLSRLPAGLRGDGRGRRARADAHGGDGRRDRRPPVGLPLSARRGRRHRIAGARHAARDRQGPHPARGQQDRDPEPRRRLGECLVAAEDLAAKGLSTTVADARFRQAARHRPGPAPRARARGADHHRGGRGRRLRQPRAAASRDGRHARPRPEGAADGAARPLHRPRLAGCGSTPRPASTRRTSWRPLWRRSASGPSGRGDEIVVRFELLKDAGILVVEPKGALSADDFLAIARTIDPHIEEHGKLTGLLIDAPSFPGWDSFGALIQHLKFVRDHHRRIDRVAAVTDNAFLQIAPRIAAHLAHPEIRVFAGDDRAQALAWLQKHA